MKKTKLTRSLLAACSIVALSAVMYGCVHNGDDPEPMVTPMPPEPMEPMPMDASGSIMLTAEQSAALLAVLPNNGDSVELNVGADGTTRAGVTFTCDSDYPCTVTVSNSAGTIVAMWMSQTLGSGTASAMASGLEPPVDTFAEFNAGSTDAIRGLVVGAGDNTGTVPPGFTATELIGMGIGGPGVLPEKAMPGLRSMFDPNGAGFGAAPGDAAAAPGAVPALTMGTTLSGAMRPDGDGIPASDDMAMAPTDWAMKTLHRDWGDTAGDTGDGGYETAAIVVKNLGPGTPHPFDRDLAGEYVNVAAQALFRLSIRADGTAPGVTTLGTSVDIDSAATPTNTQALTATPTQWANMVFDEGSLVPAQSQDTNVNMGETFRGSYFGASGQFRCLAAAAESCAIARDADDDTIILPADTDGATDGIQSSGRWSFTPDPGAMMMVPDQDWMAYGAWLTTPDDMAGTHRMGVFFNGMDTYAFTADTVDATNAAGLRGSATYSGGATGVYVDGDDSGLFTARAMLTADFDKASNGADDAVDYMISGRIDNFRGTDGVYLGEHTQANPNDPSAGENDWVVLLNAFDIGTNGVDGVIDPTGTSGSADGVPWLGMWNGQFFGPSDGEPSGVAGRFWAETAESSYDWRRRCRRWPGHGRRRRVRRG